VVVVLVDDRSLESLGRWPFSRALFARALAMLDQAGAKVVAFDFLFTEPDEPVPAELREAARAAAEALAGESSEGLRAALEKLADSGRDNRFAAAIQASGHVLLPIGLSFVDTPGEEPAWLSQSAYARFEKSELSPVFPLRPKSAVLPIKTLGVASAGLGHVTIAYDRDGAPRYDYTALPFEADFLPSLSIRATAAYLGVAWPQVALALGTGLGIGDVAVPTDRAMRLLINYRGPRDTFPSFSFADLLAGRVMADKLAGRIVLIGASFAGSSDSFAQPFGNTPMPGVERMANIIDTIIGHDRRDGNNPGGGGADRGHDRIPADALCRTRWSDPGCGLGRRGAARFCAECVVAARRTDGCIGDQRGDGAAVPLLGRRSRRPPHSHGLPPVSRAGAGRRAGGPSGALAAGRGDAADDNPVL
jgi:hypothetical protein